MKISRLQLLMLSVVQSLTACFFVGLRIESSSSFSQLVSDPCFLLPISCALLLVSGTCFFSGCCVFSCFLLLVSHFLLSITGCCLVYVFCFFSGCCLLFSCFLLLIFGCCFVSGLLFLISGCCLVSGSCFFSGVCLVFGSSFIPGCRCSLALASSLVAACSLASYSCSQIQEANLRIVYPCGT